VHFQIAIGTHKIATFDLVEEIRLFFDLWGEFVEFEDFDCLVEGLEGIEVLAPLVEFLPLLPKKPGLLKNLKRVLIVLSIGPYSRHSFIYLIEVQRMFDLISLDVAELGAEDGAVTVFLMSERSYGWVDTLTFCGILMWRSKA